MLRITPHVAQGECLLKLEGSLAGAWVAELAASWRDTTVAAQSQRVRVDLTDVWYVDDAGRALLMSMYRSGVLFSAKGLVMPDLLQGISRTVDGGPRS
jgi:ABC-type transporter Mla MlaB component